MKKDLSQYNPLNWDIDQAPSKDQIAQKAKEDYENNLHFMRCFGSESGKKVLDWLVLHTLSAPTWWPGRDETYGYFREGQNSLIRQIQSKIEQARNYEVNNDRSK